MTKHERKDFAVGDGVWLTGRVTHIIEVDGTTRVTVVVAGYPYPITLNTEAMEKIL